MLSTTLVRDYQFRAIWVELYVAIRHIGPPKSWNRVSKTDREVSQLWKGRAEEDALPGEEGGAVKLECQECGKEWLRPARGWEQCG
jgi:hypothetical protein